MFAAIDHSFGRIDVLVNNAGILATQSRLEDLGFERMQRIFAVNSIGPILCAQQAVKRMSYRHNGPGGVVALVIGFGSSSALAGAYGLAVTGAMLVDAALATMVAILVWRWKWPVAVGVFGFLAIPDLAFFIANALKIPDGGWLPLIVAIFVYFTITTWRKGRRLVATELSEGSLPLRQFLERMERAPNRVAGTARRPTTTVFRRNRSSASGLSVMVVRSVSLVSVAGADAVGAACAIAASIR